MAVYLDKTLDDFLCEIEADEGPYNMQIYTSSKQIEDDNHPYAHLESVNQILGREFLERFPDEFNKHVARLGVRLSQFFDSAETHPAVKDFYQKYGEPVKKAELDAEFEFQSELRYFIISPVNALVWHAVEIGNKDNPAKPVSISRFYGSKGAVYAIAHKGRANLRKIGTTYTARPESLTEYPNRMLRGLFDTHYHDFAFSKNGHETYLMVKANNPATGHLTPHRY